MGALSIGGDAMTATHPGQHHAPDRSATRATVRVTNAVDEGER